MQESELVKKLQLGDNRAFRVLVEEYKDHVYNTCLGFLRNPEDAEDLTQDVFIEIFESIDEFREEASLGTWIYRIAVNKSLELIRRRQRKKRFGFFRALMNIDDEPDEVSGQDFFPHPGLALENKERAEILMKAITTLTDQQRTAYTLHKIEKLSYREIAEIMKTSLSAVESLMHRAKKNLQKELHEYYKGE